MLAIARSKEEAIRKVKGKGIYIETERFYWVNTDKGLRKVLKPLSNDLVIQKLENGNFPPKYLDDIFKGKIKKTKALLTALRTNKEGLILSGKAGIGKTFACIYKITKLIKEYKINSPLYISLQDFDISEEREKFKNFDSYLLDDFNPNLNDYERKFAINIIYHAYSNKKKLFITTNASLKKFGEFIREEPILSRLKELTEIKTIDDKDFRLEK